MQYLGETSQHFTHCILGVSRIITRVELGFITKLEIRSVEHGICPIAEFTSPLLSCVAILAIRP